MRNKSSLPAITLAENIQELLKARNENWATVVRRVGMNRSTLYNWTYGVAPSSLKSLVKLSDYFGVSLDELCLSKEGRNDEPESVIVSFEMKNLVIKDKK